MASQLEVYNMALSVVGTRSAVSAVNEQSNEASTLNVWWAHVVDDVLRRHNWGFARRQITLADAGTAQEGWDYKYALPQNCVKFREIYNPSGPANRIPFEVAGDDDTQGNPIQVVLTNQYQAVGIFTKRITTTTVWDAGFTAAVAHRLAAKVCFTLTGDGGKAQAVMADAENVFLDAAAADANETSRKQDITPDWISIRGNSGSLTLADGTVIY